MQGPGQTGLPGMVISVVVMLIMLVTGSLAYAFWLLPATTVDYTGSTMDSPRPSLAGAPRSCTRPDDDEVECVLTGQDVSHVQGTGRAIHLAAESLHTVEDQLSRYHSCHYCVAATSTAMAQASRPRHGPKVESSTLWDLGPTVPCDARAEATNRRLTYTR